MGSYDLLPALYAVSLEQSDPSPADETPLQDHLHFAWSAVSSLLSCFAPRLDGRPSWAPAALKDCAAVLCRNCQASGDDSTSCSAGLLPSIWATRPAGKVRLAEHEHCSSTVRPDGCPVDPRLHSEPRQKAVCLHSILMHRLVLSACHHQAQRMLAASQLQVWSSAMQPG